MRPKRRAGFDESRTGAATALHALHAGRGHARRSSMGCGVGYRIRPRGHVRISIALVKCGRGADAVLPRRRRGGARPTVGQAEPCGRGESVAPDLARIRARLLVGRGGSGPFVSPLLFQRLAVSRLRRGPGRPLWVSPRRQSDFISGVSVGSKSCLGTRWESLRRRLRAT